MTPNSLPLFPLETVLFPGMVLPLRIFEPRYRKLIAARAERDPVFGIVRTRSGREVGDQPEIYNIGTAAATVQAIRYEDGRVDLAVRGGERFRVIGGHWDEGYLTAEVAWLPGIAAAEPSAEADHLARRVRAAFAAYLDILEQTTGQRIAAPEIAGAPVDVAYAVCAMMPFGAAASQRLLEAEPVLPLLRLLVSMLRRERDLLLATGVGGAAPDHPGRRFLPN